MAFKKKMKHPILTFLFITVLFSTIIQAETKIYVTEIPGLHQEDGKGSYDKIIDAILIKPGLATIEVLPPARAERTFDLCRNCCFSPGNNNPDFYDYGSEIVETDPMNIAKIYIFTTEDQKTLNKIEDLAGKNVGIRFGMPYGKAIESGLKKYGLNTFTAHTIEKNIQKLDAGRVDAFVAYVPDAYFAFKRLNKDPYPHDVENPIAVHEDCLVCRDVPETLVEYFNEKLDEMRKNGQLRKILGGGYVE